MKKNNSLIISLSLCTCFSLSVMANNTQLEDVTVVSASGFEQNIADAPASISVISAEELEKKAYSSVLDAVKNVPGVFVNGGGGTELDIDLRGMSSEFTLYLIDGKPISSGRNIHAGSQERSGKVAGNLPNIDMIERIEVIRGPMSSLYGSEAMGGVINIITKKVSNKWTGSLSTEYTSSRNNISNDSKNASLYLSGPLIEDKLSLSLNAYKEKSEEGNTEVEDSRTQAEIKKIGGRLNWKINDKTDLGLEYSYTKQDNKESSTPEDNVYGQTKKMYALTNEYKEENYNIKSYIQMDKARALEGQNQKEDILTLNTQGTYYFENNITTAGVNYKEEEFESGLNVNQGSVERWLGALFIENEWSVSEDFALTLGARYNYDEYFNSEITPRIYGVYSLTDNLVLKGGVSTGYKQPGITQAVDGYASEVKNRGRVIGVEVGNPDLKPEKSVNYEIGFNYNLPEQRLNSSLMIFKTDYKNKLMTNYTCGNQRNTAGGCIYNGVDYRFLREQINVDKAEIKGLEFTASYDIIPSVNISANYSYTKTEQKSGDDAGEPLNEVPKHMYNINLNWDATSTLTFWTQYNYRGKVPESSTSEFPSYYFADLGLVYKATKDISLKAGVYNFTNKKVTEEEGYDTVLDGRRIIVGLNYKF